MAHLSHRITQPPVSTCIGKAGSARLPARLPGCPGHMRSPRTRLVFEGQKTSGSPDWEELTLRLASRTQEAQGAAKPLVEDLLLGGAACLGV